MTCVGYVAILCVVLVSTVGCASSRARRYEEARRQRHEELGPLSLVCDDDFHRAYVLPVDGWHGLTIRTDPYRGVDLYSSGRTIGTFATSFWLDAPNLPWGDVAQELAARETPAVRVHRVKSNWSAPGYVSRNVYLIDATNFAKGIGQDCTIGMAIFDDSTDEDERAAVENFSRVTYREFAPLDVPFQVP